MQNKLLPCPFCGGKAHIYWEAWQEISAESGVYKLTVNHSRECFFERMVGLSGKGQMISNDEEVLIKVWNTRKPMELIAGEINLLERKQKKIMRETGINSEVFEIVRIDEYVKLDEVLDIVKGGVDNAE